MAEDGSPTRKGFMQEEALKELAGGGQLPLGVALRCRVRYFTDGAIFGTGEFVDGVFNANRERYGPKRTSGARKMSGADWGGSEGEGVWLRDLWRIDRGRSD